MTERGGKPICLYLTAGQQHESPVATALLVTALDRLWHDTVAGDAAYRTAEIRNWLLAREIEVVIPKRSDELGENDYDQATYREHSVIECAFNRGTLWVQALPTHRDPLRETGAQLLDHDRGRRDSGMALTLPTGP